MISSATADDAVDDVVDDDDDGGGVDDGQWRGEHAFLGFQGMRLYAIRAARERVAAERVAAIVEAKARVKAWGAWRFTLSRVDHITQIRHTALQASFCSSAPRALPTTEFLARRPVQRSDPPHRAAGELRASAPLRTAACDAGWTGWRSRPPVDFITPPVARDARLVVMQMAYSVTGASRR